MNTNLKNTLIALMLATSSLAMGMERPPQPPSNGKLLMEMVRSAFAYTRTTQQPAKQATNKKLPTFMDMVKEEENKQKEQQNDNYMRARIAQLPPDLKRNLLNRYFYTEPGPAADARETYYRMYILRDFITTDTLLEFFKSLPNDDSGNIYACQMIQKLKDLPNIHDPRLLPLFKDIRGQHFFRELGQFYHYQLIETSHRVFYSLQNNPTNLDWKNANGMTSLMLAVSNGDSIGVLALLDAGAQPNIQDNEGMTALMRAVSHNNIEITVLLLNRFADLNLKDKNGKTAMDWAIERDCTKIIELLTYIIKEESATKLLPPA